MNKMLKVILVIMLASGLLITSCSSRSSPTSPTPTYPLEINVLGEKDECFIDSQGRLKSKVEVSSGDGRISLSVDKGTQVLDKDGKPLQIIHAVANPSPPPPPEDAYIVGSAYNLEPQGATFNPWLKLTLSYDLEKISEGVRENDLYIAYHNGAEWDMLRYKNIDTQTHSITTHVPHFTSFAILAPRAATPSSTPTQGTQVGNLAPDFQYQDADGQSTSLGDLRGKPVLINFWATWCKPCVYEMPFIQEVYEEWSGKGLVVLAINVGESHSKVEEFMQSNNLSLPVLLDTRQGIALKYNIRFFPTTFLIDKDGIIQAKIIGAFPSKAAIEQNLSKIIP